MNLEASITKAFDATSVNAETTVWSPASGYRFRIFKMLVTSSRDGNLVFKDNTGGATILVVPCKAGAPVDVELLGPGIASGAVNRALTCTGPASATLSGFIQGTEDP